MALKKQEEKQKDAAPQAAAESATKDETASTDAPAPTAKDEAAATDTPAPATKDEASTDAPAPATKDEAAATDTPAPASKDDDVKEDQPETPKTANQEKVSRISRDLQLLKEIKEKHGDKKLVTVANNSKVQLRQPSSGTWIKGKADLRNDGWLHNQVRAGLLKLAED